MENGIDGWKPSRRKRTKVEMSSFRREIEERLQTQSAAAVASWLRQEGEVISERSLRNYRNNVISPKKALIHGEDLYSEYCGDLNAKIDAVRELHNLVLLQIKRLNGGLGVEQMKGALSSQTNMSIDLLRKLLTDLLAAELDLGIRRRIVPEDNNVSDDYLKDLLQKVMNINPTEAQSDTNTDNDSSKGH